MPPRQAKDLRADLILQSGHVIEDVTPRGDGTVVVVGRLRGQRAEAAVFHEQQIVQVIGERRQP